MKKLSVVLTTPVILALTIVCIISTPAQDTNAKIFMDNTDQSWPSTSGPIIASHDLPKALETSLPNLSRKKLYWGMNLIPYLAQIPIVAND